LHHRFGDRLADRAVGDKAAVVERDDAVGKLGARLRSVVSTIRWPRLTIYCSCHLQDLRLINRNAFLSQPTILNE
jgi:hypothetical protein